MKRWLALSVSLLILTAICGCEDSEERRARYAQKRPAPQPQKREFPPPPLPTINEKKQPKVVVMSEFGDKDSMTQITGMSGRNIVVVFYAPWCEHCSQYREALMKYAKSQKGRCYVVTVDADKYPDLAKKFEVDAVPKTILYVEGMKLREMVGCVSAERLEKLISETLSAE